MRPSSAPDLSGLIRVPVSGLAWLVHRQITGPHAVLEVPVEASEDAHTWQLRVARLRRVAEDPTVGAVLLVLRESPGGWASASDLRAALAVLRGAGKRVVSWVEHATNATMWIAAAGDEIVVPPMIDVAVVGVGAELTFGAGLLHRLGFEPDLVAAGAYKAFGEPFTRTQASPENLEATRAIVDDLQEALLQGLAAGRRRSVPEVRAAVAAGPLSPARAVEAGLVDRIAYLDEVRAELKERLGKRSRRLKWRTWAVQDAVMQWIDGWGAERKVVVLHLQGGIVHDDESGRPAIRARRVGPVLRALAEDDHVGAVVLHVQSPGGSATASDQIWHDVVKLAEKKPVVASFADVSASGGYYLATAAREIWARPETLTGSIGVFAGKFVMREGLRRVGVQVQPVKAAPRALWLSPSRAFDAEERAMLRVHLQRIYDGFVERTAQGRGRTVEDVEPSCRGRVWTGRRAAERGLVDRQGDLHAAVHRAAELAGWGERRWRRHDMVPPTPKPFGEVVAGLVRRQVPGLDGALGGVLGLAAGLGRVGATWLGVVAAHPGEPLLLWKDPFDPR